MPRRLVLLAMRNADGSETLGVKSGDAIIDVRRAAELLGLAAPTQLEALLRQGSVDAIDALVAAALSSDRAKPAIVAESELTPGRLFTHPGKIICVGLNYRRHAEEVGMAPPPCPILFGKYNNALAAHKGNIKLPPRELAYEFDYETELLVVMGRPARNVAAAEALDYVAGYCCANDFSARDLQLELPGKQWLVGKSLDGFAPIGPYFVGADLVGDPNRLRIETRVNGELRQSSSTSDFIFNVQQVIAYISTLWTLEPGDIIFTGTPEGVIAGYPEAKRVWLKPGDELVCSIEKLGDLRFGLA